MRPSYRFGAWVVLLFVNMGGCGVLGAPIPPEDVGVSPIVERQLRREGLLAPGASVWGSASRPMPPTAVRIEDVLSAPEPDPLPDPPLRQMGTR
ncbi:MAG: hypothetical protein NBKEAIPA_01973 [Nitrospirae bacterium]|nr:hypothetical protein [Nitrospirota bacterium]MEB2337974.1 hypothetical protein [Nitrospirales bacterium]QOJ35058.1 MAG: hypothetical protein HRU82_08885 [Nitrospira sp.]